jgi:hypothetical protein
MTVKSTELKNGEPKQARYRSPTAMVDPYVAAHATILMLRGVSILLLLLSTFGNYIAFIGGWNAPWRLAWPIIAAAVLYQVVFSLAQWGTKALARATHNWAWGLGYAFALIASAVPSFLAYNGWAGPWLAFQVGVWPAGIIIFIAAVGADALPEWVLVG